MRHNSSARRYAQDTSRDATRTYLDSEYRDIQLNACHTEPSSIISTHCQVNPCRRHGNHLHIPPWCYRIITRIQCSKCMVTAVQRYPPRQDTQLSLTNRATHLCNKQMTCLIPKNDLSRMCQRTEFGRSICVKRRRHKYKLLCPRGTQTCALAVANIKVNGNTAHR